MPTPIRETARAVILQDDSFLFIRRTRQNNQGTIDNWLSIPGGGIEEDETPHQAVRRELEEELGVTVVVKSLLAVQDVPQDEARHYYFLCTIQEGAPHIQEQSEEYERMQGKIPNTYAIEWTRRDSPLLPDDLYWAYKEAYEMFLPFVETGREQPLTLATLH